MSSDSFPYRRIVKPEAPLRAVITYGDYVVRGWAETLTLEGLFVRLKAHDLSVSKERVRIDLFLAASNGPRVFTAEARIIRVEEGGVVLQFRPMPLAHHNRLQAIISFITHERGDTS